MELTKSRGLKATKGGRPLKATKTPMADSPEAFRQRVERGQYGEEFKRQYLGIRLLHDEVLIRLIAPEKVNHGLWIPDNAKRPSGELWRGTVVAIGPGRRTPKKGILILPDVQVGDLVGFFWRAALVDVTKWPDEDHRIIHETDIQWKAIA